MDQSNEVMSSKQKSSYGYIALKIWSKHVLKPSLIQIIFKKYSPDDIVIVGVPSFIEHLTRI